MTTTERSVPPTNVTTSKVTETVPAEPKETARADDESVTDPSIAEAVGVEPSEEQAPPDGVDPDADGKAVESSAKRRRTVNWSRVLVYGVLPGIALVLAICAGLLKFQDSSVSDGDAARIASLQAAKDGTVAILSYQPGTVEQQLGAARDLLTGQFQDSYTQLTNDVVIPGAKQKQISAVATVPAAASVSADENHAVALVMVDQTVVIGNGAPSASASTVRVGMDKVNGRWLISAFDPV